MQHTPVSRGPGCATYSMHWGHATRCDLPRLGMGGDTPNFRTRALISTDDTWGVMILMNTNAIGINGPRLGRIENGVFDVLLGQSPVVAASHDMPSVIGMSVIAVVTALLLVGIARSIVLLRRWRTHGEPRPPGWLRVGWYVAFPLVCGALWMAFLSQVVQFARSFSG